VKLSVHNVIFEGTPEELRESGLQALMDALPSQNGDGNEAPVVVGSEFAGDIQRFLGQRVPASIRPTAERIIREALSWGDVRAEVGGNTPGGRYLRFKRGGSRNGAFLYLHPKKAWYRLGKDAAEGRTYAYARDVVDTNPHQVVVPLWEPAAVTEALELARLAYEEAA
jgi:hypothetical protein